MHSFVTFVKGENFLPLSLVDLLVCSVKPGCNTNGGLPYPRSARICFLLSSEESTINCYIGETFQVPQRSMTLNSAAGKCITFRVFNYHHNAIRRVVLICATERVVILNTITTYGVLVYFVPPQHVFANSGHAVGPKIA